MSDDDRPDHWPPADPPAWGADPSPGAEPVALSRSSRPARDRAAAANEPVSADTHAGNGRGRTRREHPRPSSPGRAAGESTDDATSVAGAGPRARVGALGQRVAALRRARAARHPGLAAAAWLRGRGPAALLRRGDGAGSPPALRAVTPPPPHEPPVPLRRTRLKKLRFAAILTAILVLGLMSFVFGMFMAVASDLPQLEAKPEFNNASNTRLVDVQGRALAVLTRHNRILLKPSQIPAIVKDAVIAVEDKRFLHNSGVDVKGIGRALVQDVVHNGAVQGASTIEQQFVKNALQAQSHRTIFEKLREAALAYHLTRRWKKDKIITEYLNTIYFGNGAYGIEAAAETYFGQNVNHQGCGQLHKEPCVAHLEPWEAALLAGVIASPTGYDPVAHPVHALARRNVVLRDMLDQGYITPSEYRTSVAVSLPAPQQIQPPQQTRAQGLETGYFDNWVTQQVIGRYGAQRAFEGGLVVRTSLDLDLQRAAEQAIGAYLGSASGPTASMVVIDNATAQVRAMVGGTDFNHRPFNLATEGERQPGSAFKAFDLAAALGRGISPYSVWPSHQANFHDPRTGAVFAVHNDEGSYTGSNTLAGATADSDNSIFARVGITVGTERIARIAHRMGLTTPISTNYAMTIGGLTTGVTVLDMAHAYETLAQNGRRTSGTLTPAGAPTGIVSVRQPDGHVDRNAPRYQRVLSPGVASTETSMLEGVVSGGTGTAANIGQFAAGKTGTTSNYGDAWFVGWNSQYTVAVWVGYPDKLVPMTTQFRGGPVLGGTFPALIWHDFMLSALQIDQARAARAVGGASGASGPQGAAPVISTPTAPSGAPALAPGPGTPHSATPPPSSAAPAVPRAPTTPPASRPSPAPAHPAPAPAPPPTAGGGSGGTNAPTGGAPAG